MTFGIGRGFAEVQILKTVKFNSKTVWDILIKVCRHVDIDKIKLKELQNDIYHRSRLYRAPNSEKVKMALSLKLSGIF